MEINIIPFVPEEKSLFYSDSEKNQELECIGHLRGDFGRGGNEFWHKWFEHKNCLKTEEFRDEFDLIINLLRKNGLLKDRSSMAEYCFAHRDAQIPGAWPSEVYGFRVNTGGYSYFIRCFPYDGDYNFYVYCYRRGQEHRQDVANGRPNQHTVPKRWNKSHR